MFVFVEIITCAAAQCSCPPRRQKSCTHRRNDTRAIRPYQPRLVLSLEHVRDPHHVVLWNAFRDTHDQPNLRVDRLFDTRSCQRWRDEDGAGICTRLLHGIANARKDRFAQMLGARLLRVRAADDICAVFDCLCRVERALSSSEALIDDLGVA